MRELEKLNIETDILNLPCDPKDDISFRPSKKILWGVAPTGEPHLGYAFFIRLLDYLKTQGYAPVILLADFHGYLDNKKVTWESVNSRTAVYEQYFGFLGFEVIKASDFYTQADYSNLLYKLSTDMDLDKVLGAGHTSLEKSAEKPSVSDVLCVASQIIDPLFLGADVVISGNDESPIYRYGLPFINEKMDKSIRHIYGPMCPGLASSEMHASLSSNNNILLSDSDEVIKDKVQKYFQQEEKDLALVHYCLNTLFPLANLDKETQELSNAISCSDFLQMQLILINGILKVLQQCDPVNRSYFHHKISSPSPLDPNISIRHVLDSSTTSLQTINEFKSVRVLKNPIFVVGCPRSGTTVIGKALMAHPKLAGDDESLFVLDLWRIYSDLHGGDNERSWAPLKSFIRSDTLLESIAKFMDSVFSNFQTSDVSYIDHTPWYVSLIPFIHLIYPDATFVHVIRNGIDVVKSLGVSYKNGFSWAGKDITERAELWSKLVRDGISAKKALKDKYIEIHYEQFCQNPTKQLETILKHVGLDWDERCQEPLAIRHATPSRAGDITLGKHTSTKKQSLPSYTDINWSLMDILNFENSARDTMQLSGYPDEITTLKKSLNFQQHRTDTASKGRNSSIPNLGCFFATLKPKKRNINFLIQKNPCLKGLVLEEIIGDGSCLFRAIARVLGNDKATLRNMVANYLEENPREFVEIIAASEITREEYIRRVRETNEYGGHLEIEVIQRQIMRPIIIIRPDANPNMPDDFTHYQGEPIFVYFNGRTDFLAHYDALVVESGYSASNILNLIENAVIENKFSFSHIDATQQEKPSGKIAIK